MKNTQVNDRTQAGFTLIEVLVTAAIVGTTLVASSWALAGAALARETLQEAPYTASLLAKEIHSLALTLPKSPSGKPGATKAADVEALDSLIGARFNPPIRANLVTSTALKDWTQSVDVAIFDTSDLTTPNSDDPAAGISLGDQKLYRLTVTIEDGGAVADDFVWWIAP
jgi:prepilin-type N-terminal cleavage/methylation domain-containing protein